MTAPSNLSNVVTLIEEGQSTQAIQEMSRCLEDQSTARKLSQYGQKITEIHRIETEQKESLGEIIQGKAFRPGHTGPDNENENNKNARP